MLGDNIRMQRLMRKYKQEYVAQQAGISQSAYSRIESGETDPPWSRIVAIAKAIGCSLRDFLEGLA